MVWLKDVKEIIKQLQEGKYIKIDSKGIIGTDEYIIIKKDESKGITLSSICDIGSSGT